MVGIDADTEQLVKFNGAVQVAAGPSLALGILPRVSVLALAVSWCRRRSPVTASGRRRTNGPRPADRPLLKNAAMMGGLLMIIEPG